MIAFLKDANQAEKYAQQENPERIRDFRDFLKKIGSNFRIADRTLVLDFKNAFKIAEKYHAEALCAEAVSYDFTKVKIGGEGGIRTHGTLSRTTDFKSVAFDHSATSPHGLFLYA